MILEVLLTLALPIYVILLAIWWGFCYVVKMMSDAENILDNNECFADTANTPKERIEQHKKRVCLKGAISKEKPVVDQNNRHMEELTKLAIESVNKV